MVFVRFSAGNVSAGDDPDAAPQVSSGAVGAAALQALEQFGKTKLRAILRTRKLCGAPINLAFTDVDDIVQKVQRELDV